MRSTRDLYDFELEPEVRDWLDSLSNSNFKRVDEVCGMLAQRGTELGGPWSDHLEGAVWEMRMKGRDGIARAAYVTASGQRVVVVHVFTKKTQKTPRREIETALKRAKEVR